MPPCWKWLSGWGWQTWRWLMCPEHSYWIWGFAPLRKLQLFSQSSSLPTSSLVLALGERFQVQVRISGCDPGQLVAFPWSHDPTGNKAMHCSLAVPHKAGMGRMGSWHIPRESQFKWVIWRPLGLWIHTNGVWVEFLLWPADMGYELWIMLTWGYAGEFPHAVANAEYFLWAQNP